MEFRTLLLPLLALALSVAVVLFGYAELQREGRRTIGLSTWMFAAGPFGGFLLGIWFADGLSYEVRIVVVGILVVAAAVSLRILYRQATREGVRSGNRAREL